MTPVEINGRLLVDGGIANNLPIDEARKLCADVIIAVDISTPPLTRDKLKSALTVSAQLINFLGKATVEQQVRSLTDRDVLICPKLGDISAGSFDRAKDSIRIGEEAARAAADRLRRYSLPPEQYAALRATQTAERKDLAAVDETRFEGLQRTNPEVLRSLVQTKPGEPLSEEQIGADLRRIYGRGDFESVDYRIVQEPGKRVMIIQPRAKADWGPDYLRFGQIATDFRGEAPFTALVQYRKTWLNRLGGEWLTEAQIGRESRLFTEFYQPVDERGRWFVGPYASVSRSTRGVFVGENRVAEHDVKEAASAWMRAPCSAAGVSCGSVPVAPHRARVDTGSGGAALGPETSAGMRRLLADQLDNPFFRAAAIAPSARHTWPTRVSAPTATTSGSEGDFIVAKSWGAHSFNVNVHAGRSPPERPRDESFTLGGPCGSRLYRIDEFAGRRMAYGRVMYYNRIPLPANPAGLGRHAGAALEAGLGTRPLRRIGAQGPDMVGIGISGAKRSPARPFRDRRRGARAWSLYLLLGVP
jgi:NTE family protein